MKKDRYFITNTNCIRERSERLAAYFFLSNLVHALKRKNILTSNLIFYGNTSEKALLLELFFCSQKLKEYKKTNLKASPLKNNLEKEKLNSTLGLMQDNCNLTFKVRNLNLLLREKEDILIDFANFFDKLSKKLFRKRGTLFCDFLKAIALVHGKYASASLLLRLLVTLFASLRKRSHSAFLVFLKKLFARLIRKGNSKVLGVKLVLSGRIKGKARASVSKLVVGRVALTSEKADVHKSQAHIYTMYGAFGLKLWINYRKD